MIVWPVTNLLASPARYSTVPARSSVSRLRFSAWFSRIDTMPFSNFAPKNSLVPSVSTAVGAIALTRIQSRPSSRASARVMPMTAALEAE